MIIDSIIKIIIAIILLIYCIVALMITVLSGFIYDNPNSGGLFTNLLGISSCLAFPISIISLNLFFTNPDEYLVPIFIIYINISLIYLSYVLIEKFNNGKF